MLDYKGKAAEFDKNIKIQNGRRIFENKVAEVQEHEKFAK